MIDGVECERRSWAWLEETVPHERGDLHGRHAVDSQCTYAWTVCDSECQRELVVFVDHSSISTARQNLVRSHLGNSMRRLLIDPLSGQQHAHHINKDSVGITMPPRAIKQGIRCCCCLNGLIGHTSLF